jgi:glycosyltransferase involved in cell wall biosynthesis
MIFRQDKYEISVVIPVWNGERYLLEAIASVQAQTVTVSELIVVDDGSTDGTARIAKGLSDTTYIYQHRSGQSVARNVGASRSRFRFLAFLDADDLWVSKKLERQLEQFDRNPGLDVVFGHAIQFRERNSAGVAIPVGPPVPAQLPGAMLIRREAFDRVGAYSSEWRVGEVVDWYARAVDCKLAMVTVDDIVLERRLHDDNLGTRTERPADDYLQIVRNLLARRREHKP